MLPICHTLCLITNTPPPQQVTTHLKVCNVLSESHNTHKRLNLTWRAWCTYVGLSQEKKERLLMAVSYWIGRSKKVCVLML